MEAEYRNVPVRSKEKEVTKYNETNKVVNLQTDAVLSELPGRTINDLSYAERHTEYVTVLDQNSNTPTGTSGSRTTYKDDNAPANDLKSYINIGDWASTPVSDSNFSNMTGGAAVVGPPVCLPKNLVYLLYVRIDHTAQMLTRPVCHAGCRAFVCLQ